MEKDDGDDERLGYVLSDIHVENTPIEKHLGERNKCISEVSFILPCNNHTCQEFDEDGDMIVQRPEKTKFLIEHYLETSLTDVGLQLWKASLYLSDYLIANSSQVFAKPVQVIELGAGVGLTTLVCSLFADQVICTDLQSIVQIAEQNYHLNETTINDLRMKHGCAADTVVSFNALDWTVDEQELVAFKTANLFLAADVIYDDELTIKFLNILFKLMSCVEHQPKCAYIALEKRINFEATSLETASSCYDYFEQSMLELDDYTTDDGIQFQTELLALPHLAKHMINYDRSEYLMIWKVTTKPKTTSSQQ